MVVTNKKTFVKKIVRYTVPLLITILWLSFIYSNSLKTGAESSEQSGKVYEIVNDIAVELGVKEPISEKAIRKCAHFAEFAVLALLVCIDMVAFGIISRRKKLYISIVWCSLSVPICALFASVDEMLQHLSEGRGPSVADVLIDTSGALAAALVFVVFYILLYIYSKNAKSKSLYAEKI